MGEDNLRSLHKWKNYEFLLQEYPIYVYPRMLETAEAWPTFEQGIIHRVAAPIIELSATMIRDGIKNGKNVAPMLPEAVWKYIDQNVFYR
jgi:nicotinate-nucleotide adenylyltransferase